MKDMSNTSDRTRHLERGRTNQKRRTRQALLDAGTRLLAQGRSPSLAEVAEEALVSRTTPLLPSIEALLREAFLRRSPQRATLRRPVGAVERVYASRLNEILFAQVSTSSYGTFNLAGAPRRQPVRPGRRLRYRRRPGTTRQAQPKKLRRLPTHSRSTSAPKLCSRPRRLRTRGRQARQVTAGQAGPRTPALLD
jgi:AcrR family transcriptional regulator